MHNLTSIFSLFLALSSTVWAETKNGEKPNKEVNEMTQQYREGVSKRITNVDRVNILNIFAEALAVLHKEKELTEFDSPFGLYHHTEPKSGVLKRKSYRTNMTVVNFSRENDHSDWTKVSIGLEIGDLVITDFRQTEFDSLGLMLEGVVEGVYKSTQTPTGKDLGKVVDLPCYNYIFRLKRNNNITVKFVVYPEMMNKRERFPRNFNLVFMNKN